LICRLGFERFIEIVRIGSARPIVCRWQDVVYLRSAVERRSHSFTTAARRIGGAARRRILREHTYGHRAAQVEGRLLQSTAVAA
jgi:hypothetical protein